MKKNYLEDMNPTKYMETYTIIEFSRKFKKFLKISKFYLSYKSVYFIQFL